MRSQVGHVLRAVLEAARARDVEDAGSGCASIGADDAEYALRLVEDPSGEAEGSLAEQSEDEEFGAVGKELQGPWKVDVDFPELDAAALLGSVGVTAFLVTLRSPEAAAVSAEVLASATDSAEPTTLPASPWARAGDSVVLRARIPVSHVYTHAGEMRSDSRMRVPVTVERPTRRGTLGARFLVPVGPAPTHFSRGFHSRVPTDPPPADLLSSSLRSGGMIMPP
jgi:hypothetical protein